MDMSDTGTSDMNRMYSPRYREMKPAPWLDHWARKTTVPNRVSWK